MDKLERQEQDPRIRSLKRLARRVVPADKPEAEWERIERAVFERLDRRERPAPVLVPFGWLLRPRTAVAVAALAGLALALAYGVRTVMPARPLPLLALTLHVTGTAYVCDPGRPPDRECAWTPLASAAQVLPGCRIRTLSGSSVAAVLDTGTGFVLGEGSLLHVDALSQRHQQYELDAGTIRVHLRRRGSDQSLVVVTRNAVSEAIGTVFTVTAGHDSLPTTLLSVENGTVRIIARRAAERSRVVAAPGTVRLVGDMFAEDIAMAPPESAQADTAVPVDMPEVRPESLAPALPPLPLPSVGFTVEPVPAADTQAAPRLAAPVPADTLQAAPVPSQQVDSAYLAGRMAGRDFFWRYDQVRLDTLGWAEVVQPELTGLGAGQKGPGATVAQAAAAGLRFVEAVEPTALSVMLLRQLGYTVLFRTQWSVGIQSAGPADDRTFIQGERAFTDHLWERLDRGVVSRSPRLKSGVCYVQLRFAGAGYAEFEGEKTLPFAQAPLAGAEGIALRQVAGKRLVAGNVVRQFAGCYLLIGREKRLDALVREVEERLDTQGCDGSYRRPQFREVR